MPMHGSVSCCVENLAIDSNDVCNLILYEDGYMHIESVWNAKNCGLRRITKNPRLGAGTQLGTTVSESL